MKIFYLILLLFFNFTLHGQVLKVREQNQLIGLGINLNQLKINDTHVQQNLQAILKLERKRKINKTLGIVFACFSGFGIASGTYILLKGKNDPTEGKVITSIYGGMMLAGGIVYGGISIPFFTSAKKRKKERDIIAGKYLEPSLSTKMQVTKSK